ncbi:MAG: hypothetical protein ACRD3W_17380, partial [Terriglobales bacterium]
MKRLIALASVATLALSSAPVLAQHHGRRSDHGRSYNSPRHVTHHQSYRVGHRFGPRYSYTSYNALPRTYVTRYHLSPRYRYVYNGG